MHAIRCPLRFTMSFLLPSFVLRLDSSQGNGTGKDKSKGDGKESASPLKTSLHSPKEGLSVVDDLDPAHLPDDSGDDLSNIDSPESEPPSMIGDGADFPKMSVYSPSQERFSIPEDIATEAQTTSSLPTSAVSDIQGAKHYIGESEFPPTATSTTSETTPNYYNPSSTRSYSFSQPSIAQSPLMSPSTYPAAFNPQAFPAGTTDGVMTAGTTMYPNGAACMSPSAYMSPYGTTGKQYTWPTTPSAYGTFGTNAHDLMQSGYAYQSSPYTQMARSGYPASYFPTPVPTSTSHTS